MLSVSVPLIISPSPWFFHCSKSRSIVEVLVSVEFEVDVDLEVDS